MTQCSAAPLLRAPALLHALCIAHLLRHKLGHRATRLKVQHHRQVSRCEQTLLDVAAAGGGGEHAGETG